MTPKDYKPVHPACTVYVVAAQCAPHWHLGSAKMVFQQ